MFFDGKLYRFDTEFNSSCIPSVLTKCLTDDFVTEESAFYTYVANLSFRLAILAMINNLSGFLSDSFLLNQHYFLTTDLSSILASDFLQPRGTMAIGIMNCLANLDYNIDTQVAGSLPSTDVSKFTLNGVYSVEFNKVYKDAYQGFKFPNLNKYISCLIATGALSAVPRPPKRLMRDS